jgi:outer membrane receptor protein involved in Fe transport
MPTVGRLALACGLALCSFQSVHAQEQQDASSSAAAESTPTEIDAIVVTGRSGATRRTKAETSYSLTDIDEERLRLQAPTSVTEAMKSVPGFWVEASGGEASGNIRARGVPVDGFGSVNILEDGMPVQHDPALGWLNGDQAFRLDETIERIEVVRGGPSSVFYSNAPAGVINFIPRQVGDEASGVYKLTVGDDGLRRYDFYTGAPLGNGWKAWIGGFWRSEDGIRDPGFKANDGGQVRAGFGRDFDNGSFSFDWKHVDDRVALYLGIPMQREGAEIRAVPGIDGSHGTLAGPETERLQMLKADGSLYDFDNSLGTHVQRDQYTAKFEYGAEDGWQFRDTLRYSTTDTQRNGVFGNQVYGVPAFLDQAADLLDDRLAAIPGYAGLQLRYVNDPSQPVDPLTVNGNGLMIVGGLRAVTPRVLELANDARLVRRFEFGSQSHDLTFGYYYARFDQDFDRYSSSVLLDVQDQARLLDLYAVDADGNPLQSITDGGFWQYGYEWENASGRSKTHAFYVADEWQVNEQLRIDAGVRHERVQTEGWVELRGPVSAGDTWPTSQILTGSGTFLGYDESFSKTGWTVGANWQFTPRSGLFARWTSAFRLPNLSSFITRNSNCTPAELEACLAANTPPVIQTMDLGEVGYKFSDQSFDLFATLFYTKYDNVGFSDTKFDLNGNRVTNRGEASTRTVGLELEAAWYPTPLFDLQLTATVQEPEYRDLRYSEIVDGQPVLRDFVGNQLVRVPKHSLRLVPGLNLLDDRLRLQLTYEYQGERYADTANSVRLPSYDVWSASARYQVNDRWSLFLYGDNLDNSLGLTEGNPRAGELQSGDAGANVFLARPLLGRQYRAAVMYQF